MQVSVAEWRGWDEYPAAACCIFEKLHRVVPAARPSHKGDVDGMILDALVAHIDHQCRMEAPGAGRFHIASPQI